MHKEIKGGRCLEEREREKGSDGGGDIVRVERGDI